MIPSQKKSETIEDDKEKAETPASGSAKTLGYNPRTNEDYIPKAPWKGAF